MGLTSETERREGENRDGRLDLTVLVIASSSETAAPVEGALARRGFALATAQSGERALRELAASRNTRLVVLVLPFADLPVATLVSKLREIDTHVPVIIVGRDGDVATPEAAVALGAADYLEDPGAEPHEFLSRVGFVVGARRGDRHLQYLHSKVLPAAGWQSIIGQSSALRQVVSVLQQVCARAQRGAPPTIFLGGETGTGKGYIARTVHSNGARKNRAFVEVNCAALPASLIEAELFGHERGSFTDAKTARSGLFETADGGTLFLDEIGTLPLDLQAKLLTAIEEKRVRRLGARTSSSVDVQIIAATHADLRQKVREGTFREDLFHRLNVVSVTIPPLRQRGEDVILLAESFLRQFCREYGIPERRFSQDAKEWMLAYAWPGNVRELKNQIERIVLLGDDEVVHSDQFPSALDQAPKSTRSGAPANVEIRTNRGQVQVSLPEGGVSLEELEREILRQALFQCEGNVSRAARFLSISRQTFMYRMKKHGLSDDGK